MASIWTRALLLTILLFGVNFAFIKMLDESRATDLFNQVGVLDEQTQNNRVELLQMQAAGNLTQACETLANQTLTQVGKLYQLGAALENIERSNFLGDTARVRRQFILSNAELLAYGQLLEKSCGAKYFEPILYFYPDQTQCFNCKVQAEELNKVTLACPRARVFAFPTDSGLSALERLQTQYNITTYPSVVVNGKTKAGITLAADIESQIQCK
jgi:hypothetical protein